MLPIFPTFQTPGSHKFFLFDFSDKFDGLIGLDLIKQLNADLNFNTCTLKLPRANLPICHNIQNPLTHNLEYSKLNYIISPRSIQKIRIPVKLTNGYGIIPYQKLGHIEIPECLIKIQNNMALTTALNPKENPIKLQFLEALDVEPVNINELNFFNHPNAQEISDQNTDELLKTNLKKSG